MPDRDKTIRDLEYLISFVGASQQLAVMQIATDALVLLKEQEAEIRQLRLALDGIIFETDEKFMGEL